MSVRVLLVDDEEIIRDVLREILEEIGLVVEEAGDGLEALDILENAPTRFQLVISDMKMPKMSGPKFLEQIRENPKLKHIKFIFITGGINYDFENEQDPIMKSVDAVFNKPFEEDKIEESIRQLFKL
ncbi:MAG: response regulator [Bdellovibrionales bacterium]